jgi:hypothetical protein
MRAGVLGAASLAAILLAGCATAPTLNRWSKVSGVPDYQPPLLYVSSAPAAAESRSDPLTLKALPERVGAAYVKALADREKATKDLRAALAAPFNTREDAGTTNTTRVPRVLMLSVQRAAVRPGDRLLATTISIRPVGFRFTDYTLAATERSAINIGAVSVTDQRSANLSASPGPWMGGLTGAVTASRSETGTRAIKVTAELSVHVAPDAIDAYRTGAEGQDLTGAALIKLAFQLPDDRAREYTIAEAHVSDDDGKLVPAAKAKIETHRILLAPVADLYVCARLTFEDRAITGGAESYDEGRQAVTLRSGVLPWASYLVAPYQDLETPLWLVMAGAGPVMFDDGLRASVLTFDDYDAARDFQAWLARMKTATLANGTLKTGSPGHPEDIGRFDDLNVTRVPQTRGVSTAPVCGADGQAIAAAAPGA